MLRLFLFLLVLLQDLSGFQDSCTLVSGQTPDIFVLSFRCIPHQDRFTLHLKGASNQTTPGTPQICRIKEIVKLLGMLLQISPKMFEHLPDKTLRTCMMCVSGTSMKLLEQKKMLRISGSSLPFVPWTLSIQKSFQLHGKLPWWWMSNRVRESRFSPGDHGASAHAQIDPSWSQRHHLWRKETFDTSAWILTLYILEVRTPITKAIWWEKEEKATTDVPKPYLYRKT